MGAKHGPSSGGASAFLTRSSRRKGTSVAALLGLLLVSLLVAPPADAVYPVTGTTTSASPSEIAGCTADQSARHRDPESVVYWFKRGQVWFVSGGETGAADFCFIFGNPGDIGVMGTWGIPGVYWPTPGVFRPSTGQWFLSGSEFGSAAAQVRVLGGPGDVPVVGDWNGDRIDDIGVVRGQTWFLQTDPHSIIAQGTRTVGLPGDVPVGGTAAAYQYAQPGMPLTVFRPSIASFVLYTDGDVFNVPYNQVGSGDVPVAPVNVGQPPLLEDATYSTDVYRPERATLFKGTYQGSAGISWEPAQIGQAGDQVLRSGFACSLGPPCVYP